MNKLIFVGYLLLLFGFTIFSYVFVDPNFLYLNNPFKNYQFDHRAIVTILYITFITLFFIFYFLFIKFYTENNLTVRNIKWLIGLTVVFLLFSYSAMLSHDIFNYVATAKVTYSYKENPYIVMPIEFVGDPILRFTHAANKIALYGPLWILLTSVPYAVGLGNYLVTMFVFKIFIAAFYIATVWLVQKISNNWLTIIIFALNPLVIVETLVGNHNDIVMIFFALLAIHLIYSKKIFFGGLFLFLSIFIKYSTIFLLPVMVYVVWKQGSGKKTSWGKVTLLSTAAMFTIFLLSPFREEIYPWYFIWPFTFVIFQFKKKLFLYGMIALSFGLMFRYIPFMFLRTHFGPTPVIKSFVTFAPLVALLLYYFWKKRWQKILSH